MDRTTFGPNDLGRVSRSQERHTMGGSQLRSTSSSQGSASGAPIFRTQQNLIANNVRKTTNNQTLADQIFYYLTMSNYENSIAVKQLLTPTTKIFNQVFLFLLRQFEPNIQVENIALDDIPLIMKSIGYPYIISKNILQSVGAPHTTSHVLCLLSWMCSLLM